MATETLQRGQMGYSKQQKQLREASGTSPVPVAPTNPITPVNSQVATTIGSNQYNSGGGVVNPYGTAPIVSPNAPITSATMAPSTPVALPTQIQPTAAAGMAGAVEATNKSVAQQRAEALTAQQENEVASRGNLNNQLLQEMMGVNTEMTNASASIDRTEQNKLREESDSLTRQIEMEQESTRQKVNALREANPQGLFGGALQDEMERLQRDSGNRLATLAIQRSAAMRDFATAASIANEQLRLKLEPLKLKSDNLKLFYEDNKDRFNKADDRLFAEVTRKAEQEYKKAEAVETELLNVKKELFKNGAPADVIQAAQSATSVEELLVIPGISQYMQSPLEKLQMQKYAQDITKGGIDIAKARKELSKLMENTPAPGLTTSQREDLIKNPTAKQAQARIGVIKAVEDYGKKVSLYKEGLLTGSELRELNTALKTTVGSAINVAQGQGAMGEEEGKRILDNLEAGRLTREKKTLAAVKGVMEAQDSLLQTELQFLDSGIPGASDSFQLFADYKRSKTDPLLLNSAPSGKDSLGLGI